MGFKNSRLERRFIWREESQRKVSDVEARRAAVLLEWIRKRGREKDFWVVGRNTSRSDRSGGRTDGRSEWTGGKKV